jgi:hypothetical protein
VRNLTVQKVFLALITLGFFIAAPWITSQTIGGNSAPLLSLLGVALLLIVLFAVRDRCWMLIPLTLPIEGNLNFLPLNFSIQEIPGYSGSKKQSLAPQMAIFFFCM